MERKVFLSLKRARDQFKSPIHLAHSLIQAINSSNDRQQKISNWNMCTYTTFFYLYLFLFGTPNFRSHRLSQNKLTTAAATPAAAIKWVRAICNNSCSLLTCFVVPISLGYKPLFHYKYVWCGRKKRRKKIQNRTQSLAFMLQLVIRQNSLFFTNYFLFFIQFLRMTSTRDLTLSTPTCWI